ncbi:hypothetical protein KFE25_013187 [Diacronema lutheri]|uniref:Rieske domain-containing protein n=1 Tax=Diacronema lutheri TaxID=2081491 RepID=A0A8J6C385_DIALT|nr:hypothetical protein KFE25_013187 [Diacronema lutheri]
MAGARADVDEWVLAARPGEVGGDVGARKHLQLNERFVSLIRGRNGGLHCLDSVCYHAGGPLLIGDVEDVNGVECIRCPWHAYPVRLVDGAKPYKRLHVMPDGTLGRASWELSERRQRVHMVDERADGVWVRLTSDARVDRHAEGAECESDRWAYRESAGRNVLRHGGPLKHAKY